MKPDTIKAELFKLTLDSLPDGILLVDSNRRVIYSNDSFREMWRIPSDVLRSGKSMTLIGFVKNQVEDSDLFVSKVEHLYCSTESYQDEIRFKDGRIFRRRSESFHDETIGNTRIWIFLYFSDRKRAE